MTNKTFFDTPEYLAARAKAIKYLEDRLMKEVGAEVLEDVHKARAYDRGKGTFWVAYNENRNHIVIVAGDGQLWLDEGYMLKSVTFP